MIQFVFMVEEISMEECLKNILPKILPDNISPPIIIPHEGKNDLEKSIPRKLRAWKDYPECQYKFIIIRDQDNGDCRNIKNRLTALCSANGRSDSLIRIACQELESWFLGDLQAVANGLSIVNLSRRQNQRKYRNPDYLGNPSQEMSKLCNGSYRKVEGARKISREMNIENNCSKSFQVFVHGVQKLIV